MKKNTNATVKTITTSWVLLLVMTFMSKNSEAANIFSTVKSKLTIEAHRIWINATDSSTGAFSQTLFGYRTDATEGYDDGLEAAYFNDGPIALTSLIGAERYTIQFRGPYFNSNDIIPLSFKTNYNGNFTFSLDHVDGLFSIGTQPIYILDTANNVYTNLKTSNYTFSCTIGTYNDRFKLVYFNPDQASSLGTNNNAFNSSDLMVLQQQDNMVIKTGNTVLKSVAIYNLNGQILYQNYNVNDSQLTVTHWNTNHQTVIIRAVTTEGIVVSKKWLCYQ